MSNESKRQVWDFDDEETTYEFVTEIRHYLYEGYYKCSIVGDELTEGSKYVVENMKEIQGLDCASQVELVRMGYCRLADDMGNFAHALRSIAERGTTVFYGPAINIKGEM
jgi:hypothetical protein